MKYSGKRDKGISTSKVAMSGLLLAMALILGYVEALIPLNIGIPGVKLGLPNLAIVLLLYASGVRQAFIMDILRIFLSGFLFGNMYSIYYSLAGGILSFLVMVFMKKSGLFSALGVSLAGGVSHNIGQLVIAYIVLRSGGLIYYVPVLMISGAITGVIIGKVSQLVLPYVNRLFVD